MHQSTEQAVTKALESKYNIRPLFKRIDTTDSAHTLHQEAQKETMRGTAGLAEARKQRLTDAAELLYGAPDATSCPRNSGRLELATFVEVM